MATPTISGVLGVPSSPVAPGTAVPLTIEVSDADSRPVTLQFTVTDSSGATSAPTSITIDVQDIASADGVIVSGGGTLVRTGPLAFTYTA